MKESKKKLHYEIDGRVFRTFREAWEAVGKPRGVKYSTAISRWSSMRYTIEECMKPEPHNIIPNGVPCIVGGRKYPTIKSASDALGLDVRRVYFWAQKTDLNEEDGRPVNLDRAIKLYKGRGPTIGGKTYRSVKAAWADFAATSDVCYETALRRFRLGLCPDDKIFNRSI